MRTEAACTHRLENEKLEYESVETMAENSDEGKWVRCAVWEAGSMFRPWARELRNSPPGFGFIVILLIPVMGWNGFWFFSCLCEFFYLQDTFS